MKEYCLSSVLMPAHIMLSHIHNYVDKKAYLRNTTIHYGIKQNGKWKQKVMPLKESKRIVDELYGPT